MRFINTNHSHDSHTDVPARINIWHCRECGAFHVRAENVVLTFTYEEFVGFSYAVTECCYGGAEAQVELQRYEEERRDSLRDDEMNTSRFFSPLTSLLEH